MKDMCTNYKHASRIAFIDCLTMFCGSSGEHPGALFGGRAQAEPQYFDADQLHLSDKGYIIWKLQIEDAIKELLNAR
jgi:lysophospholipase L1-like esterase